MTSFESEKRDFIRVKVSVPVKYKLIMSEIVHVAMDLIHDGTTSNLSGGGLLLRARIPQLDWLPLLLTGKMKIGVNLILPTSQLPVKALTRVSWIEGLEEGTQKANFGLRFTEITLDAQEEILRYIIKSQMPG